MNIEVFGLRRSGLASEWWKTERPALELAHVSVGGGIQPHCDNVLTHHHDACWPSTVRQDEFLSI